MSGNFKMIEALMLGAILIYCLLTLGHFAKIDCADSISPALSELKRSRWTVKVSMLAQRMLS